MISLAIKRFLSTVLVLWGVVTITFLLLHLTPGDPVDLLMGDVGDAHGAAALRHELGLDQTLPVQYAMYIKRLAQGDWGKSYATEKPVLQEIKEHFPATFLLAVSSMFFAILVGIPLGVLAAVKRSRWMDFLTESYTLFGLSMPSFWLGPLLIIFFAIRLDWFPVGGEDNGAASLVLPAVSLGLGLSAVILRMTRAAVLEVMNEEYIRVARAKGQKESLIFFKHALKNALTPIITVVSLQFGAVLTGVVITETIFDWPGLGLLLYSGLKSRNYPLVQGCVLLIAVLYVAVNLMADVAYLFVNPRLWQSI